MKNEIRIFFTALMFYTRIPCPSYTDHSEEYLNKATRYFPLIGWIVGAGVVLTIYLLHFILPLPICVILSLATSVLMTGSFHEDGFADVCDGFGGGWTQAKILEIMKDSRVGTYGVVALIILFLLKISSTVELLQLDETFAFKSIFLAHVLSRFTAISILFTHQYAREDATSKIKPLAKSLSIKNLVISALITIPAILLFQNPYVFLVFIPVYLVKMYLASYFTKWIGGYTGDCLGATQQITEVVIYLAMLILWKYIS
jgi:adenosylcobinamide-GDP ribazoletransferase